MKTTISCLLACLLVSCTSNTIYQKPKDLIPKDTMRLLIEEIMIASSAKYFKNKNLERKIDYMPFVYDKFKIDSTRFKKSNLYYTTEIDLYEKIITEVKTNLEKRKEELGALKLRLDSIKKDSLEKRKNAFKKIEKPEINLK